MSEQKWKLVFYLHHQKFAPFITFFVAQNKDLFHHIVRFRYIDNMT